MVSRNVQIIDSMEFGDMLVWGRDPGQLRLAATGGFPSFSYTVMTKVIKAEAGKTYYVDFSIRTDRGAYFENILHIFSEKIKGDKYEHTSC